MKYLKKPVVIDAIRYTGDNKREIKEFTENTALTNTCHSFLTIPTLEGNHRADVGDWIIKGVAGEFYPCKSDIFITTYSPATCNSCKHFPKYAPLYCDKVLNLISPLDAACEKGEV